MQITITNQALQHVYVLANQHKEKTQQDIFTLDMLFDAIEDSVQEFETQVRSMQETGKNLTEKSKNTSIKQKEREQATQELQQLDKDFEAVHFSCVALDLQKPVVEMMKHIVECAIDEEKIVGRRHVKCASQALFAIDEYLAKA